MVPDHRPSRGTAVTSDQGMSVGVAFLPVCIDVFGHFGLARAAANIRRAPSRAISSGAAEPSSSRQAVSTIFNMGGVLLCSAPADVLAVVFTRRDTVSFSRLQSTTFGHISWKKRDFVQNVSVK